MTARILTAVALFATTAVAAPVPKDTRKPVEYDGGTYRVTFPTKPAADPTSTGTDSQGNFTRHGVVGESADGAIGFGVKVRESDTNFDTEMTPEDVADQFRNNAKRLGTVEDERVTSVGSDVVARWFTIKMESGEYLRALAFVRGNRMYTVVVGAATREAVDSKEADKFFDSFVLTK